jgi:hypothetical protein
MIFNYNQFLLEFNRYSDVSDIKTTINDIKHFDPTLILAYRGVEDREFTKKPKKPNFYKYDPTQTERSGKGWILKYIKRLQIDYTFYQTISNSVICSTNESTARKWSEIDKEYSMDYDDLVVAKDKVTYVTIPLIDEICVSITEDFTSFSLPYLVENINFGWISPPEIVREIEGIETAYQNMYDDDNGVDVPFPKNVSLDYKFKFIQEYDVEDIEDIFDKVDTKNTLTFCKEFQNFIDSNRNINTFTEALQDLCDPENNGMKKMKFSDFQNSGKTYENCEVWFNCPVVMVNVHTWNDIKNKL